MYLASSKFDIIVTMETPGVNMFAEVNYVRRHIYNSNLTQSEKRVMQISPPVLKWPDLEPNRGYRRQRSKPSLLPIVSELSLWFCHSISGRKIKGVY